MLNGAIVCYDNAMSFKQLLRSDAVSILLRFTAILCNKRELHQQ